MKQPTSEECSQQTIVREDDNEIVYAMWHPQWGGYGGRCLVSFGKGCSAGHCFDVVNWHDGEFPRNDAAKRLHYCNAVQLIRFGTEILEKQLAHYVPEANINDEGAVRNQDEIRQLAARLLVLADEE